MKRSSVGTGAMGSGQIKADHCPAVSGSQNTIACSKSSASLELGPFTKVHFRKHESWANAPIELPASCDASFSAR